MSKRYFTYDKYTPESMMTERTKAPHPPSRPKEENLNHRCVNVEKPFSGLFQIFVLVSGQVHFLLFLADFEMGICLLIIVFAPHLELHLNQNKGKLGVDLRGIRS
jgi:hypothetical protein